MTSLDVRRPLTSRHTGSLLAQVRGTAVTDGVHLPAQSGGSSSSSSSSSSGSGGGGAGADEANSQLLKEIKYQVLLRIVDKFDMSQCMIFCRTNVDCDNLEAFLNQVGGSKQFSGKVVCGSAVPAWNECRLVAVHAF